MNNDIKARMKVIDECNGPVHHLNVNCIGEELTLASCSRRMAQIKNNHSCAIFLSCPGNMDAQSPDKLASNHYYFHFQKPDGYVGMGI